MARRPNSKEVEQFQQKLLQATNAANLPHFDDAAIQETKVSIKPDKSISPAKFKADPERPGCYLAHPTTIAAMRKDLFVGGDDEFIDLERIYSCEGCGVDIDIQFWTFCPHCEAKFPSHWEIV